MSDHLIQRAGLLLQQRKFREAENILSGLFAEDPANVHVLALLCEVKLQQNMPKEALDLVNSAIGFDPSSDYLFYKRACVYIQLDKYNNAEKDLQQAINLQPYESAYFALFALLKLDRKEFEEARILAEKALELDPANISALNARSTALLKLNRKEESFSTIQGALREDPDNAYTHANYGWGLLEKSSHKEALNHFSIALQKDPNLKLAQAGMAEALKARYFLYRLFLRYAFWMGNMKSKLQWIFIIGIFLGRYLLEALAEMFPPLNGLITPLIIIIALFAFSTWVMTPLANLFLRFNKYGKHLLSPDEMRSSNFVALSVLTALAGAILLPVMNTEAPLAMIVFGLTMMIPLSVMFRSVKSRKTLVAYTAVLAFLGVLAVTIAFVSNQLLNNVSMLYLLGVFIFQWVANYILSREASK
ncbi:tetratricopeptide repeat protein [Filimonas effusa]|uniref:Tetratricopeptide repeat protein n=1 Tax=Filimonas effusa TaxID=2508721 RepID=A0A4Q1D3R9_9BACT|nr:tetratricopeptide repeat protein [Filimonas effusa]RXK81959.1 tetratricopeptide repeat protein [Filimonas effusa]